MTTSEAIYIKLSDILNNQEPFEDEKGKINEDDRDWYDKIRRDAERKKRGRESQKYRSHY